MKLSEFQQALERYPDYELAWILPDGGRVPAHAHITEAGRVDRRFMDCGGTVRHTAACNLQAWVADDIEHRLAPGKLAAVLDRASALFAGDDLEVELEYEDGILSQFPVLEAAVQDGVLYFRLGLKHTDCLAKELCVPQSAAAGNCCSGTGCC